MIGSRDEINKMRERHEERLSSRDRTRWKKLSGYSLVFLIVTILFAILMGIGLHIQGDLSGIATLGMLISIALSFYFEARSIFIKKWGRVSAGWVVTDKSAMIFGSILCLVAVGFLGLAVFLVTIFF